MLKSQFHFRTCSYLLLIVLNLFCSQGHAAQLLKFEGKAIDIETEELLYIETHQVILDAEGQYRSSHVAYHYPNGEQFAEKTLDYSKSILAPDLYFQDKRSDEQTYVTLEPNTNYLNVSVEQVDTKKETNIKLLEPYVVVDAGFDRLIDTQWRELNDKKEFDFVFLAITRAQLFNFEAQVIATDEDRTYLELHPRNFFINMLVEPILLEYDNTSRRLMRFEGLTNIEKFIDGKGSGENFIARIDYRYEPLKPILPVAAIE